MFSFKPFACVQYSRRFDSNIGQRRGFFYHLQQVLLRENGKLPRETVEDFDYGLNFLKNNNLEP